MTNGDPSQTLARMSQPGREAAKRATFIKKNKKNKKSFVLHTCSQVVVVTRQPVFRRRVGEWRGKKRR